MPIPARISSQDDLGLHVAGRLPGRVACDPARSADRAVFEALRQPGPSMRVRLLPPDHLRPRDSLGRAKDGHLALSACAPGNLRLALAAHDLAVAPAQLDRSVAFAAVNLKRALPPELQLGVGAFEAAIPAAPAAASVPAWEPPFSINELGCEW